MENFEGIWDFEVEKIDADIIDLKEKSRMNKIISELNLYKNDVSKVTDIYTDILKDENMIKLMIKVSQSAKFYEDFPEFFSCNDFDENVINCQQNSKYHKFGVFRHTLEAIKNVGNLRGIPYSDYELRILKWTMLLHDIGKPFVKTTNENGNDSFLGHEDVSFEMAKGILERFKFTQDEKQTILKLIKYHDKFINQGEITYDNMKFLSNELNNDKKIFNLLLEVKEADAKAKCDEVYETFLQVRQKYVEFINTYFSMGNSYSVNNVIDESLENNSIKTDNINQNIEIIENEEYDRILESAINRKNLQVYYQPMINLATKKVAAYEMFTKIDDSKQVPIIDLLNYSKNVGRFEKLQQILMINAISEFEKVENKETNVVFINIDFDSYNKYVNKPRIYDMMSRQKIVIEFKNYANKSDLEIVIKTIKQHGGFVSLDNFEMSGISLEYLNSLKPNFIKLDVEFLQNVSVDSEKQKYMIGISNACLSNNIDLITVGVENRETLITLKNIGIKYVQGYFFAYPDKSIVLLNNEISKLMDNINNENTL